MNSVMIKIFGSTAYTLSDLVKLWQNKKGFAKNLPFFNCAAVKSQIFGASRTYIKPSSFVRAQLDICNLWKSWSIFVLVLHLIVKITC